MRPSGLIQREHCVLAVIDIQERLMGHIGNAQEVLAGSSRLIQAARHLEVPILWSEQYPRGLGPTVEDIASLLKDQARLEKTSFACQGSSEWKDSLAKCARTTLVLCGVESHVCVLQTALQALEARFRVVVAADAIGSRNAANHFVALDRMRQDGATVATVEMVLMEWLRDARHPKFKDVQRLIK